MSVLDEMKTIKGVTDAAIIEPGAQNLQSVTEMVAVFLYTTGQKIGTLAGLGDFQQAVLNVENGRGLVFAHGQKLIGLALTENASPLIVSKQARALLAQGKE